MNTRLKNVRKHFNKTQNDFGSSLGVSRDTYASYEGGRVLPKDTFLQLLCSVYRVNYSWIKSGEGEMLAVAEDTIINDLALAHNLDDLDTHIIECYVKLEAGERQVLKKYLTSLTAKISKQLSEEEQIEIEVERYRQELWEEKRAKDESSALEEQKQA